MNNGLATKFRQNPESEIASLRAHISTRDGQGGIDFGFASIFLRSTEAHCEFRRDQANYHASGGVTLPGIR